MTEISINLIWKLENGEMSPGKYSNKHEIILTPNIRIIGDSAPDWRGNKLNILNKLQLPQLVAAT